MHCDALGISCKDIGDSEVMGKEAAMSKALETVRKLVDSYSRDLENVK